MRQITMMPLRCAKSWQRHAPLLAAWLFVAGGCAWADSRIVTYPFPQQMPASPRFRLMADRQAVPVLTTEGGDFAAFALSGRIEIAVVHDRPVTNAVVRPRSRGIIPEARGWQVRFTVDRPGPLCVEVNGDTKTPLFLFIDPTEIDVPTRGTPGVTVLPGNKVHDLGEIRLKDRETLYLEPGAVVRGTVRAQGARHITIRGRGIFDARLRSTKTHLMEFKDCTDVELSEVMVIGSLGWTLVPWRCRDVRLNNVKVLGWRDNDDGLDICGSRDVRVDRCFFRTKDDCISVKSLASEYFPAVTNSADSAAARPSGPEVANVQVRRSVFWNAEWGNAMEIGFELRTSRVRKIVWRDCDIIREERGAVFSIHNGDFASVEDVLFQNIHVEDAQNNLVDFRVGLSIYSGDCPERFHRRNPQRQPTGAGQWVPWNLLTPVEQSGSRAERGAIRNVRFRDIQLLEGVVRPSTIVNQGGVIQNVRFENIRLGDHLLKTSEDLRLKVEGAEDVRCLK
jgi:hypothetical protein